MGSMLLSSLAFKGDCSQNIFVETKNSLFHWYDSKMLNKELQSIRIYTSPVKM